MRTILISFVCLFYISSHGNPCENGGPGGKKKDPQLDIETAFTMAYKSAQEALSKSNVQNIKLEGIDLEFATSQSSTTSGGFTIVVLSGKYSRTKAKSSTTTFSFGVIDKKEEAFTEEADKFRDYLVKVLMAADKVKNIDNFGMKEFEITIEFSVTKTGEGGLKFEFTPFELSTDKNWEKEIKHSITFKFKKEASRKGS